MTSRSKATPSKYVLEYISSSISQLSRSVLNADGSKNLANQNNKTRKITRRVPQNTQNLLQRGSTGLPATLVVSCYNFTRRCTF